jgi:hypothetical protein
MNTLRIKIEIPQKSGTPWKVATALPGHSARFSKKKTAISAYRFAENRIIKFLKGIKTSKASHSLALSHKGKTAQVAVWVSEGQYHNDGEYSDHKSALYALVAFLEDYLTKAFKEGRYKKYFTGF